MDTIPVPHAVNGAPGKIVARIPFDDFPGRWMFERHIVAHKDRGMLIFIDLAS